MASNLTLRRSMSIAESLGTNTRKIVLVGGGFLGSYIARSLIADPRNRVLIVSRHPESHHTRLAHLGAQILPPQSVDITSNSSTALDDAFKDASAVVSLVGVLVGSAKTMDKIQREGAQNVALAAQKARVPRTVLISAIGADTGAVTPYWRTKGMAEKIFLEANPSATIIRPSIIFGPGDSFFNRFATLAKWLPFLPVFGGGAVRFQPVYAGDVARAVEIACREDRQVIDQVGGKVIEAGGPDVFTYREIMGLVLRFSGLEGRRAVISLPYWLGMLQAWVLEKLPESIFTLTREQVKQLKVDNIVSPTPPIDGVDFASLLAAFPSSLPSSQPGAAGLTSVYKVLPTYLGQKASVQSGKRTHGRHADIDAFEEVKRMSGKK